MASLLETYHSLERPLARNDLSVIATLVAASEYAFKTVAGDGFVLNMRDDRAMPAVEVWLEIRAGQIADHNGQTTDSPRAFERLAAQGAELIWQAPAAAPAASTSAAATTAEDLLGHDPDAEITPAGPQTPLEATADPDTSTKMTRVYIEREELLADGDGEAVNDLILCSDLAFAVPLDQPDASSMIVMFAGPPERMEQIRVFFFDDEITSYDWAREGGRYALEDLDALKASGRGIWARGQISPVAELNERSEPDDPALRRG